MKFNSLKQDKGVAGLQILLSVIVFLFVIGLIVLVFTLASDELENATDRTNDGGDVQDHTFVLTNASYTSYTNATLLALDDISCSLYNFTNSTGDVVDSSNYTLGSTGNCYVLGADASEWNGSTLNATYSFSYSTETTASGTIENTTLAISGAIDWFDIFIVITAMVVLILLTVIIITAIRGSGLMSAGGSTGGGGGFGSA